jgi:hypothetical protein
MWEFMTMFINYFMFFVSQLFANLTRRRERIEPRLCGLLKLKITLPQM